jgi:hypothetical protein
MAIMTSQMMTSRSLICLLENQNGGKLQKEILISHRTISSYLFPISCRIRVLRQN